MDRSTSKELAFVGLQRTGTNYVRQVLKEALPGVPIRSDFWKHSLPDEVDAHSLGGNVIIVSRHPVLWLQSCLVNSAKDIRESRPDCFAEGIDQVDGYAKVFNRFYGSWLQHKRDFGGHLLRYEDVLEGDPKKLASAFSSHFELGNYSRVIAKLPQSVELSVDDVQAVLNRECSLSPELASRFWERIDPIVGRELSYTIEEISFSGSVAERQKLRSIAYKLVEKPETLSNEEFACLLREGRESFQNDGVVLGRISTRLMKDGDVEGAFDWLLFALLAFRKMSETAPLGRNLAFEFSDYLDLVAKASTTLRNRTLLTQIARLRHPKKRKVRPREQAVTGYNLSVCHAKLGHVDEAIYWADRSVELAKTIPDGLAFTDRWIHNLGVLLAKAGKGADAIEKFREAAAMAPSYHGHHFRLAQEYRKHKDLSRALESADEALRLKPKDGDITGFKVNLLREIDPEHPELLDLARRWVEAKPKNGTARLLLSNLLRKAGDVETAIEEAVAAAKYNPEEARCFSHLSELLDVQSRWNKALAAIDEAILLEPTRARHHRLRGEILRKMKRLEEARSSLEGATRCEDAQAWDFHLLGRIRALLGDRVGAAESLKKAIALEPRNQAHAKALDEVLAETAS